MSEPKPTNEDLERARRLCASRTWMLGRDFTFLAFELARVRAEEREACAAICERIRDERKANQHDPILGRAFCGEAAGAEQCMKAVRAS